MRIPREGTSAMIGKNFRATHYMVFSIIAFALFILISYYTSNNSLDSEIQAKGLKMHHAPWMDPRRMQSANQGENCESQRIRSSYRCEVLSDVNSSQPHTEGDSIGSILFKGIVSPAGTVNGSYYQYLVNQSQVEMGVPVNSGQSKGE